MKLLHIVTGALGCNNYLLVNEQSGEGVLVDCGDGAETLLETISRTNVRLNGILLTHGHADHIASAEQIADRFSCPIYIHRADEVLLKRALFNLSPQVLGRPIALKKETVFIDDGDYIVLAGFELQVIHTPGHTEGSVCFRFGELLFTGDTLFEGAIGGEFPPFGNLNKEIESIRNQLFTIKTDCVCYPGHGNKTSLFYEKENNIYCRI